MTMDDIKPD